MTRNHLIVLFTICLTTTVFGCGKKSKKDAKHEVWIAKPLAAMSGTINDQAFEIQLPNGLKKRKDSADFRTGWIPEKGDQFDYPQFSVEKSVMWHPTSPDDAAQKHLADKLNAKDVVLKKAAVAGGILLVWKSHTDKAVYAKFFHTRDKTKMYARCVWIEEDNKVPDMDKVAAWLEKVCTTFKLK